MKLFKVNDNIQVICESKNTRNGFKHTATLLYDGLERESVKICYLNRTWERYEYESVLEKLAEKTKFLMEAEKEAFKKYIKAYSEESSELKTIAMVAKMGDIFGQTKKEANDWKVRMLKAGLANKGLDMPNDWDELSENEKQNRLDKAIETLK